MGENLLVESQIADSVTLIQQLDSDGCPPTVAVWYFYDDIAKWQLILAGPRFNSLLPNQELLAYRMIGAAMRAAGLPSFFGSSVKLIRTDAALPKELVSLVATGPRTIEHAHFTDTSLNGLFIKEMVVIRSAVTLATNAA